MGKRGPKPKPTVVKIANGNPGKRKLPKNEVKPALMAEIEPPVWLDKQAKEEWRRVAPELDRLGLLTALDRSVLIGYCQAYSDYQQARVWIAEHGRIMVFRDDKGAVKGSQVAPQWSIMCKALEQMRRCGAEFGFGPASRVGLASDKQPPKSLADLLDAPAALPDLKELGAIQ